MITLSCSSSLSVLLSPGCAPPIAVDADSWEGVVGFLRTDHPHLAERILDGSDLIRMGFLVAVNDDIVTDPETGRPAVSHGDEVFFFAQMAGG